MWPFLFRGRQDWNQPSTKAAKHAKFRKPMISIGQILNSSLMRFDVPRVKIEMTCAWFALLYNFSIRSKTLVLKGKCDLTSWMSSTSTFRTAATLKPTTRTGRNWGQNSFHTFNTRSANASDFDLLYHGNVTIRVARGLQWRVGF
jgi:hypothetical protein